MIHADILGRHGKIGSHVQMRDGVNLEGSKRRYPLGENLIEPKP
jgi:hypothetical protein